MTSGFNVVDFMNLPATERSLVRLLLRKISLTYSQIHDAVTNFPDEQRLDDSKLSATLDRLTLNQWLVQQVRGQQIFYRVNSLPRTTRQTPEFWDNLELDSIDQPWSLRLCPQPEQPTMPPVMSGGKRKIPSQIWNCLIDDAPGKEQ